MMTPEKKAKLEEMASNSKRTPVCPHFYDVVCDYCYPEPEEHQWLITELKSAWDLLLTSRQELEDCKAIASKRKHQIHALRGELSKYKTSVEE